MRGHVRSLAGLSLLLMGGGPCSGSSPDGGGQQCSGNDTCPSGHCGIDGTGNCCTTACDAGDPICGAKGCDSAGACVYPTTAMHCDSCVGSLLTTRTCDGLGECAMGQGAPCPNSLSCKDATSCQSSGTGGTHIYITDRDAGVIRMDDIQGTGWTAVGGNASGTDHFMAPWGIYVDADGGIYVTDSDVTTGTARVVKTDITGSTWITLSGKAGGGDQFASLEGIWVDSAGLIYVADWRGATTRIVQASLDGTTWNTLGSTGSGSKQLNAPGGVWVDSSYLYIADRGNNRIVQTTMAGTPWNVLTGNSVGTDQFSNPRGIAFDSNGALWVADEQNNSIVETTMSGNPWVRWTFPTPSAPTAIYADPAGPVYVCSYRGNYLFEYLPSYPFNIYDAGFAMFATGPAGQLITQGAGVFVR